MIEVTVPRTKRIVGWNGAAMGDQADPPDPQDDDKDKDKDKDKHKDKDEDDEELGETGSDHKSNCVAKTGICSNRATVTITGMKKVVQVRAGSGSVLADVTSPNVNMHSNSADLTGRGLTKKGVFVTRIGNVRVKYCKKSQDTTGNNNRRKLTVKINQTNKEEDEDGNELGSDADLQFPVGSDMNIAIQKTDGMYKTDFTDNKSASFLIDGKVLLGYLFISEYPLPNPPCKY